MIISKYLVAMDSRIEMKSYTATDWAFVAAVSADDDNDDYAAVVLDLK